MLRKTFLPEVSNRPLQKEFDNDEGINLGLVVNDTDQVTPKLNQLVPPTLK